MIWRQCLPRYFWKLGKNDYQNQKYLGLPAPRVSQVCRSARDEAILYSAWKPLSWPTGPGSTAARIPLDTVRGTTGWSSIIGVRIQIDYPLRYSFPETLQFLADPKTPLCIDHACLYQDWSTDYWEGDLDPYDPEALVLEWTLDYLEHELLCQWFFKNILLKHEKCAVIMANITLPMTIQEACECGLFGLFGEENPTQVDITDTAGMRKLLSVMATALPPCCMNRSQLYILDNEAILEFLQHARALVLKSQKLYSRTLPFCYLPPVNQMSPTWIQALDKLPNFRFVVNVFWELSRDD